MINQSSGNIFFIGDFDESAEDGLVIPLTREIQRQRSKAYPRIDLYINSMGGQAHLAEHMVELVEIAKAEGVIVRTIVTSMAYSAGSMVAIAGSPGERYISRRGNHMIHYGSTGSHETTPLQADRYYEWKKADFDNVVKLYRKYASVPDLKKQIADDGLFVRAEQCIEWGLADKYMDKFDIGDYEAVPIYG